MSRSISEGSNSEPSTHITYPAAAQRLTERLQAQPSEIAAWVLLGPNAGGLSAFLASSESQTLRRFHFTYEMGNDYISSLLGCMFDRAEIERFQPADRYITGAQLLERWNTPLDGNAEAFIRSMIQNSRLIDLHPIWQCTDGAHPGQLGYAAPPTAAMRRSAVEGLEVGSNVRLAHQAISGLCTASARLKTLCLADKCPPGCRLGGST